MPENQTPTSEPVPPSNPRLGSVLVGHSVDNELGEAWVCLAVNEQAARLSVAGARIVAAQITTWAYHAEERNKARPGNELRVLMHRVIEKDAVAPPASEEPKTEWRSLDPENKAVDDAIQINLGAIAKVVSKHSKKRSAKKARKAKRK